MKLVRVGLIGALVIACALPAVPASAQEALPEDPATEVLAILSPVVAPACALSGTSTLLVPIVSGLVAPYLPAEIPSVGDLLLNSIGPLFVVCGALPAPPGSRCQIDDQIAGLLPVEVSSLTGPTPGFLGNLIDTLDQLLKVVGLEPLAAVRDALVCTVNQGAGVTDAPAAEAPPEEAPPVEDLVIDESFAPIDVALPSLAPSITPSAAPVARSAPQQLVATVDRSLPGGLKGLQIATAALLALTLLAGWGGAWRESRRGGSR
jgi:hypothetical protein